MLMKYFHAAHRRFRHRHDDLSDEHGFTMLEVIIVTALMFTITAVGIIPFTSIGENSREDALNTALYQTEQMVLKYMHDGDESTDPTDAAMIYNQGNSRDSDGNLSYGVEVQVELGLSGDDDEVYIITARHADDEEAFATREVLVN